MGLLLYKHTLADLFGKREGKSQSPSFFLACTQTWGATCVSLALTPKREKKKNKNELCCLNILISILAHLQV